MRRRRADVQPVRLRLGDNVARGVQQRVQLEHPQDAFGPARKLQRAVNAFGGHARDADQAAGAHAEASSSPAARAATAIANDRYNRCICRHTSSAIRTSAECEKAAKSKSDNNGPE